MPFTKEYSSKVILSLNAVRDAERAQRNVYDSGIVTPNESVLTTKLGPVAGILSTIFFLSTPASLAAGVISLVGSLGINEKASLEALVYSGYWNLGYLEDFLVDNPQYDLLEVNLPFIEYETAGVRFITGKGVVTRVHSGSGWIIL